MIAYKWFLFKCREFLSPRMHLSERLIVSLAVFVTLIPFLLMSTGCVYYKVTTINEYESGNILDDVIHKTYPEKKYPGKKYSMQELLILLFREHNIYLVTEEGRWFLQEPVRRPDTLVCRYYLVPPITDSAHFFENRGSRRYSPSTESMAENQVLLFSDEVIFGDSARLSIPIECIYKCDIYSPDKKKSSVPVVITIVSIGVATFLIVITVLVIKGLGEMEMQI